MTTDWGTAGFNAFKIQHSEPSPALDPTKATLRNKEFIVCVVGASRGIGAGIAEAYVKAGATGVVLASRRVSGLETTADACRAINANVRTEIVPCDITSADDVAALASKVKQSFGRLDVVAINSGYSGPVELLITDTDPATFLQATQVNYVGTFHCAKYLIPLLLDSPNGAKDFIGVSSMASFIVRGPIANAQYCVSKLAQLKLLEHLHEQYSSQGLSVYAIHPGAVDSEMARETAPEAFKAYLTDSPNLCGAFCVWLTSNNAEWLSGRMVSARWDINELLQKKDDIVKRDLLKAQVSI